MLVKEASTVAGVETPSMGVPTFACLRQFPRLARVYFYCLEYPMTKAMDFQNKIREMLMQSQFWPLDAMQTFQRNQLTQLLQHARTTVPFYQTRLDPLFKSNGDIDWNRWREIPVVTRADLREMRAEMLTTALPAGHGPTLDYSTSGSSGVPITVTTTSIANAVRRAAFARMDVQHQIDASKIWATFVFPHEIENGIDFKNNTAAFSVKKMKNGGRQIKINLKISDNDKLDLILQEKINYLSHLPNTAEIMAFENNLRKNPVRFEAFICYGQSISDEQRRIVKNSFGARCISIYSSKEAGLMAQQCHTGEHFHVNSELAIIEVINAQGLACKTGETGSLIVTPIYSTAQPLIRYEQGDLVTLGEPCACGSMLPVLTSISGRQDPIFRFPDRLGSEVLIDKVLLEKTLQARAIQLAQTGPLKFTIRYVADVQVPVAGRNTINTHLRLILHPDLQFEYQKLAEIPRNAGGKQQRFVCEFS